MVGGAKEEVGGVRNNLSARTDNVAEAEQGREAAAGSTALSPPSRIMCDATAPGDGCP